MIKISERMVNLTRLTQNQQKVMAKILAAPTPLTAYDEISRGESLIAARDILQKLGMIDVDEDKSATITDKGMSILKSMNIVDDMGQLTDAGQNMAYDQPEAPPVPQPEEPMMGGEMPPPVPPMESILSTVNALAEGRMKQLSQDVDELVDDAQGSELAQYAIRKNDVVKLKNVLVRMHGKDDMVVDLAIAKLLPRH